MRCSLSSTIHSTQTLPIQPPRTNKTTYLVAPVIPLVNIDSLLDRSGVTVTYRIVCFTSQMAVLRSTRDIVRYRASRHMKQFTCVNSSHATAVECPCNFLARVVADTARNSGPWFNIKMSSYKYRKSESWHKTVIRSFHLHGGNS